MPVKHYTEISALACLAITLFYWRLLSNVYFRLCIYWN